MIINRGNFKSACLIVIGLFFIQIIYNFLTEFRSSLLWITLVINLDMFLRLILGREDKHAMTSKGKIYKKIFGDIYLSTAQIVVFSLVMFGVYSFFKGISVYGLIIVYATISIYVAVFFSYEFFKIKSKIRNKDFDEFHFLNSLKREGPFSDSDYTRAVSLIDSLLVSLLFLFVLNVFLLCLAINDIGESYWVISFAGVLISLLILSVYYTYSNLFVDKR